MCELALDSLAYGGEAVGRLAGKVVFVPLGVPGDRVRVRLGKQHRSYARAEIAEIIAAGPGRREPPCPLFGQCGSCQWQQMDYTVQVAAKDAIFHRRMEEVGAREVKPLAAAPQELGYRRRTRLHWSSQGGVVALGYYQRQSHKLLDVACCLLLDEPLRQTLAVCRRALSAWKGRGEGTLVAVAGADGMVHVSVQANTSLPAAQAQLITGLLLSPPVCGGQLLSGHSVQLFGAPHVNLRSVEEVSLDGSAGCFVQANAAQDRVLRERLGAWAQARGQRVLELYAGVGNLTTELAPQAREVLAIESSPVGARLLQRNLAPMGDRVVTQELRAEAALASLLRERQRFDLVVLNPPREGCGTVIDQVAALRAERLIYISCDPMTLARDVTALARAGYALEAAQAVDLMPQTSQIEGIALLGRER